MKYSLFVFLFFFVFLGEAAATNVDNVSVSIELFGASTPVGLNFEYSPNSHWDIGSGFCPITSFIIIPIVELHSFVRYNILSDAISPYVELSSTVMAPGQLNECQDWFFGRVQVGAMLRTKMGLKFGLGIGYQFIGSPDVLLVQYNNFFPVFFVGGGTPHI
jgi:hypothetical protein